jgi:hypothetical protein
MLAGPPHKMENSYGRADGYNWFEQKDGSSSQKISHHAHYLEANRAFRIKWLTPPPQKKNQIKIITFDIACLELIHPTMFKTSNDEWLQIWNEIHIFDFPSFVI